MKDRAAAGKSPDNVYAVVTDVLHVDLLDGVLVFSHDNSVVVAPQHDYVLIEVVDEILFRGLIEISVFTVVDYKQHFLLLYPNTCIVSVY